MCAFTYGYAVCCMCVCVWCARLYAREYAGGRRLRHGTHTTHTHAHITSPVYRGEEKKRKNAKEEQGRQEKNKKKNELKVRKPSL